MEHLERIQLLLQEMQQSCSKLRLAYVASKITAENNAN